MCIVCMCVCVCVHVFACVCVCVRARRLAAAWEQWCHTAGVGADRASLCDEVLNVCCSYGCLICCHNICMSSAVEWWWQSRAGRLCFVIMKRWKLKCWQLFVLPTHTFRTHEAGWHWVMGRWFGRLWMKYRNACERSLEESAECEVNLGL